MQRLCQCRGIPVPGRDRQGPVAVQTIGRWAVAALALSLAAMSCLSPAQRFADHAARLGLHTTVVPGTEFRHLLYWREGHHPSRTLHVYLDGDGTPWRASRPAEDPTPRNPLVLDLMALDPYTVLYLGRPCYHGLSETSPCSRALWTHARYSEPVVASMAAALRRFLRQGDFDRVAWFGYSGGGALAFLLAPRFPETASVVTVAGNLDIHAWADLHGYGRLTGSLNPAAQPRLPAGIYQRHYVGGSDRAVPKEIVTRGPVPPDTVTVLQTYDHTCCWGEIWPVVLSEVQRALTPGR